MIRKTVGFRVRGAILTTTLVGAMVFSGVAQDGTKSIKSKEYLDMRPEGTKVEARSQVPTPRKSAGGRQKSEAAAKSHVYSVDRSFPVGPPPLEQEYVRIGVTIWRLSPQQCAIPDCPLPAGGSKGLVDTSTATRVDDSTAFSTGERVRLGLESLSHNGFVYIIDREQFEGEKPRDPFLIFPTKNIQDGYHYARPGLQIQLPRAAGCFCVKSRNPQKVLIADNLVVIVSPTPLLQPNEIGDKEIPLPAKLLSYLNRAEKEISHRAALQGGVGLAQTMSEQTAGTKGLVDTQPVLTQSDLPPQNFYQSLVPKGSPAVFNLYLKYSSKP